MGLSRRSEPRRCVAVVAAVAVLVAASGADKEPPNGKPGTIVLFDGKSLDGWKPSGFLRPGGVKVEDGTLVLPVGRPMTGVTSTRKDLPATNYELSYEAMRLSGRDFFAAATFPVGKSFATFVNGGWGGNVTGISSLNGSDASENETGRFFKYRDKTWYAFRVRVTDDVIRCWIDGKQVVDLGHRDREVATRIESRACQPLGFATWETAGAVRNVRVRSLTPAEVAATTKPD